MSGKVELAIARLRDGERAAGMRLLAEALQENPRDERAWMLLAGVVASAAQRRECLERVLAIDPGHAAAREALARLMAADQPAAAPPPPPAAAPATNEAPAASAAPATIEAPAASAAPDETAPPARAAAPFRLPAADTPAAPPAGGPRPLAIGYALLARPILTLIGTVFMTALSFGAAIEAAAGSRPEITGRNRLVKEIYAWLIITLGPTGVLVVGGALCLLALGWVALSAAVFARTLRATRPARPAAPRPPAPARKPLSPLVVRGTLVGLIVLMGGVFTWAALSQPTPVPGLIAEGTVLDLRDMGLATVSLSGVPTDRVTLVDLSGNPLTELPRDITALSQVEHLFINGTGLTHLPPEIGAMTNLRTLVLADNQLVDLPPEIGRLKQLEVLDVHGNRLRALPPQLADLPNLRQLNLQFNPLGKSAVPAALRSRPSVEIFVMYAER